MSLELDEKNRRITALLKSIEELEAEVQRWKGLADLKDAKGEANRTENNRLRAEKESILREISILPERLANRLELAMRKGEASSYDELVSLVTEVITHK